MIKNLKEWEGFAFEPKKGDWSLFQNHIFKIVSNEKQNINDWVLTWMAQIVQNPQGKRSGIALVLCGGQATGKGVFFSRFGRIFGNRFLQINAQDRISSRFNSHFKDVVFLLLNEDFLVLDKVCEDIIKSLITENTLTIESKGKEPFTVKNYINLGLALNNPFLSVNLPFGFEHRFMLLNISNSMANNKQYFRAIIKELESGGQEAMLYDLLEYDTSKIDVSKTI